MGKNDFILHTDPGSPLQDAPQAQEVHIPLRGGLPLVTPGEELPRFGAVGRPAHPLGPWTHTPVAGEVTGVQDGFVSVRSGPVAVEPVAARDLSALNGSALKNALSECGMDVDALRPARRLVVNATPPEPNIFITGRLLRDFRDTLSKGLRLARTLITPTQVTVVGPDVDASAFGNCDVVRMPPRHPNGMKTMILQAIGEKNVSKKITVINIFTLMALGRIMETGLPRTEVFLTVQGRNLRAMVGTPVHDLLEATGSLPDAGDRVSRGGPLCGQALFDLNTGLHLQDYGVTVIPQSTYPPVRDAACLNCGQCARHCPARLFPGELSMCAEAGLWERARFGHLAACFECGICGYVCPARRPLLQYLQLAKSELARLDASAQAEQPPNTAPSQDTEEA